MADSDVLGYGGLFLGSFLAPTILPLSSEAVLAVMVLGGFDPVACVLVASVGNSLGGMTSYFMGYVGKWAWVERLFARKQDKVAKVKAWADRYGSRAALFCWLPVVGDPLAVALGFVRSPVWQVGFYMLAGKFLRYAVWVWLIRQGARLFGP
jgi:membrane protein YqaA with SNARE-associated domain